jgi:hypothetical protein
MAPAQAVAHVCNGDNSDGGHAAGNCNSDCAKKVQGHTYNKDWCFTTADRDVDGDDWCWCEQAEAHEIEELEDNETEAEVPVIVHPTDTALCKDVTGIHVADTRGANFPELEVSVKHNGEAEDCGNETLSLGSLYSLEQCAFAVASNTSCFDTFQLHRETYDCACVTKWGTCEEQPDEDVCLYQLSPIVDENRDPHDGVSVLVRKEAEEGF